MSEASKIKVTVTEEITTVYEVDPAWLESNKFPNTVTDLTNMLTNGIGHLSPDDDPVDALAIHLDNATGEEQEGVSVAQYSVTERDIYLDLV